MTATATGSTTERAVAPTVPVQPGTWLCENCHRESRAQRKRCGECGTSRY